MEELIRRWTLASTLALTVWALCAAYLWVAGSPLLALSWGVPALAALSILLAFVRTSLHLNRRAREQDILQHLGGANLLTLGRGGATAALAGFLLPTSPLPWQTWLAPGLFLFVALGDILDGHWARKTGRETLLGRRLDGLVDALVILVAAAVAVKWGRLPPWFLTLGVAPYLFGLAVALRRYLGKASHPLPHRLSRRLAGALVYGFVALALSPLVSRESLSLAAVPVAIVVATSFLADWSVVVGRSPAVGSKPVWREGALPR